jgi:tRNA threonylcarbamoyladenosine biosynthesis protein TsaB
MNSHLPILAIETSGDLCSTAVLLDGNNFVELNYLQKHIHSQKLFEMIDSVLKTAGCELKQIKSIAVSIGPGSFTGLRIGLAAVKGMAFGAELPVIPVPTFTAEALHISEYLSSGIKFSLVTCASNEDYYYERYLKNGNNFEIVEKMKLIDKLFLDDLINGNELVYGNVKNSKILNNGTGSSAIKIARWAYLFGNDLLTFNYDYLEPNYFKEFIARVKQ